MGSSVLVCFLIYSRDYEGLAGGHLASNFAGRISLKRRLIFSKTHGFILFLPFVAADTDQSSCTCVTCCERFGCTGVRRERFLHFQKTNDFNA